MFRSATFKLTAYYVAIITTISLIFSVVIYHFATNELQIGLHHQTMRIYRDFPVFNGNPLLRPGEDVDAGTHHILWQLIWFNLTVVILAGIAGYFLARRTLEPIEAAHERQKRFTADVSHELRTPLTSLKMGSEVALMDKDAAKTELRSALESNLEEANKMELLVNSLLRLTRLDDEQTQASFIKIDGNEILDAAVHQVSKLANAKKVRIERSTKNISFYGDRESLIQLFVILLDNAIKYSKPGDAVALASKQDTVNISKIVVTDHGPGISKEDLPHVFDRFYRADNSRNKTTTNGFGLGLSIAKLIADRHKGNITLTSRLSHGTTATVTLPSIAPDSQ